MHVPYKGSGDAMKDHLSGVVELFFDGPTTAIANSKTGRVKLLATAAEMAREVRGLDERWGAIIREVGVKLD